MKKGRTSDGFTLMELLVVIAIMAVIMGISLPAFTTMGKGGGMRGAVSQLRSTISLSRQWAITHRSTTYIVFPYFTGSPYLNDLDYIEKACRAYAVYAVTNAATGTGEYITDWKYLPANIVFNDDPDLANSVFDDANGDYITIPIGGEDRDAFAMIFSPSGTPGGGLNAGNGYRIHLCEGYVNLYTNDLVNSEYGIRPNGLSNSVAVAGLTGGISVK